MQTLLLIERVDHPVTHAEKVAILKVSVPITREESSASNATSVKRKIIKKKTAFLDHAIVVSAT